MDPFAGLNPQQRAEAIARFKAETAARHKAEIDAAMASLDRMLERKSTQGKKVKKKRAFRP